MEHINDGDGGEEEGADDYEYAEDLCFQGEVDEQAYKYEFTDRKTTIEVEAGAGVMQVAIDIICEE
jgi:hypothetical protein